MSFPKTPSEDLRSAAHRERWQEQPAENRHPDSAPPPTWYELTPEERRKRLEYARLMVRRQMSGLSNDQLFHNYREDELRYAQWLVLQEMADQA